jgi:hypothetical protein
MTTTGAYPSWLVVKLDDARLRRLFGEVWRALPAFDVAVMQALVGGQLIVTDSPPGGRPSRNYGATARTDSGVVLLLDFFALDDMSARFCRYVTAHELSHVRHHLGGPKARSTMAAATALAQPSVTSLLPERSSYLLPNEDQADVQAAAWGFPKPSPAARRRKGKRDLVSEWTRKR